MTLRERVQIVLKGQELALMPSEVYDLYIEKFPREALDKIRNYETVRAGEKQLRVEISATLNRSFTKKIVIKYTS